MNYKTIDGLMRHLRDNNIYISGSSQKRQLVNTGYYHGYKGYRFYKESDNKLPFTSYKEVLATIQYDSSLKSLLYSKMMFIESANKNISLQSIVVNTKSEKISDMLSLSVNSYNMSSTSLSPTEKTKLQQNKLNLEKSIQTSLAISYKNRNPIITHFYNNNNYSQVPVWALFEIMTMGEFGYLLSCLTLNVRADISKQIGLYSSCDRQRILIYKYIYILKDLRNAIAHNQVVFDTRFRNTDPCPAARQCIKQELGLDYINFKSIGDYVILMSYYLKLFKVNKTEIMSFIKDFERITDTYRKSVNTDVVSIVIQNDLSYRLNVLKNFI